MVLSSLAFLYSFLPLTLLCYYLTPKQHRNLVLFVVSLLFYSWGEPRYVILMLYSTVLDYTCGRMIERYRLNPGKARFWLAVSLLGNLGLLGVFKYSDWLLGNLNQLLSLSLPLPGLRLPIGISFYTFQTMSYSIDVYRGETPAQRSLIDFGTYVTLFPQLIAGPIVRYVDVARELTERRHSLDDIGRGARGFAVGLGKKVLLANNCGLVFTQIREAMGTGQLSLVGAWLGIIAYALQVYFDFSGYSDMAVGLGGMFGFSFPQNFNYPFIARSVTEFWRRWHITLGSWFRDYLYIPLGGNRRGQLATYRNLLLVWMLTGLWHGAEWNFVWWGGFFAVTLILERYRLLNWLQRWPRPCQHLYTLALIAVSFAIFAFSSGGEILSYLASLLGSNRILITNLDLYLLSSNAALLAAAALAATPLPKLMRERWVVSRAATRTWAADLAAISWLALVLLCTAYLVDSSYNPFLYFRF
ncbi:MAG: MBOAT family O-acyltransferase [Bacillota bacterium]